MNHSMGIKDSFIDEKSIIHASLCVLLLLPCICCINSPSLVEKHRDIPVINMHNHDAAKIFHSMSTWDYYSIDKNIKTTGMNKRMANEWLFENTIH